MIAKVSENMIVPPTNKVLKVMKRIRSITAAASFQSRFLSSSSSAISRSSASFRNCARRRLRISTRSLSVVPSVASSYGWCELFWKSTASMLFFLLPTGDGVAGFSGFMRRHDASLIQINHFICRQVTDDIKSRKWSDYIRLKTANDSCTAFKDNIFISVLWLLQTVLFVCELVTNASLAKTDEPIDMPFTADSRGPKEPCNRWECTGATWRIRWIDLCEDCDSLLDGSKVIY